MLFSGSYVPLITPFDKQGRLDKSALEELVEWHISQGTDGIICAATTGEGPTLSSLEKKQIAELCIRVSNGRIPILVSTGTNDTRASVRNTRVAQKLGAAGCLVVTPYYNKPSQKGCIAHMEEIAKVGLPMILYHNPPRAVVRLTAETIIHLSKNKTICAIKESSHDLDHISQIVNHIPVLSGDDDLCYEMIKLGAVGSIATTANLIPKAWKEMVANCLKGNWEKAEAHAKNYLPLIDALFLETNPQCVKYAVSLLGKCHKALRLPMLEPTLETKKKIKQELLALALPFLENTKISSKKFK